MTNLPASGLEPITENAQSGWRLSGSNPSNYGDIGTNAIDLSISNTTSSTRGATGDYSVAFGELNSATGRGSMALGAASIASGIYSLATGEETEASGYTSSSFGSFTLATGTGAVALGEHSTASGKFSIAAGERTKAEGFGTMAIGIWNTSDPDASPETFDLSNRAFVIGNGTFPVLSDAMTVLFDGTTTIAGDLTINSDVRLKTKINSLGNTLSLIQQLDGKSFYLKNNLDKSKIGLLAQDVQEVFPQLVIEGNDEEKLLSVNYQGLIPVLINGINEQQEIIEKQQKQIDELSELVQKLIESK